MDLARELGRRLGRDVDLVTFETAGKAFAALQSQACDVGFLAIDPARAADLTFTAPYVIIEPTSFLPSRSFARSAISMSRVSGSLRGRTPLTISTSLGRLNAPPWCNIQAQKRRLKRCFGIRSMRRLACDSRFWILRSGTRVIGSSTVGLW